ncbi:hypothetical protein [Fulvivirga lutea]|uniref:Uncharacterized protein n=1 Tax=Fulvivirga lutea TaxID=2810512 RepID=A0A974WHW4_9BACT|nr:hypothetical protein [Fulvivirga lutea]QSE98048.1 hypothetical protein JR347_02905 [Fulvivirga lutea]
MHKIKLQLYVLSMVMIGLPALFSSAYAQTGDDYGAINPEFGINESYDASEKYSDESLVKPEENLDQKEKLKAPTKSISKKEVVKQRDSNDEKDKKSSSGSSGSEAESVLSFNFLYYIIQKFKFTEVIDQ